MPKNPRDEEAETFDLDEETTTVFKVEARKRDGTDSDRHLLVCTEGPHIGMVVRLPESGELHIGRHVDCELRLDVQGVSRKHAVIRKFGPFFVLQDLESANGTFVGGERIEQKVLQNADVIEFGPSAAFRYSVADKKHERMLRELYQASVTDTLTGVGNRLHFDNQLTAELAYAKRHGTSLALLLLDIDHFKRVNDTYGHPAGDEVLRRVSQLVRAALRTEDTLARYGGEEFAVLLRDAGKDEAAAVAERVRQAVGTADIEVDGHHLEVTVSIGVATAAEAGKLSLLVVADRRLYDAKEQGRNRVVAEG